MTGLNVKEKNPKKVDDGYKDTPMGRIPKEWEITALNQIFSEVNVKFSSLPPDSQNIPVLSMTRYGGLVLQSKKFDKRVASQDLANYKVVHKGNFVIGFPIDEGVIFALEKFPFGVVSPVYIVMETITNSIDGVFLDILLKMPVMIEKYKTLMNHSVERRRILKFKDFITIQVGIPPLPEQQKIADILSSVDASISETDAIIAKTEQVKRGLLQKLLVEGIGHLEFKDSEIGQVPVEWKIEYLQNIADVKGRIGWRGYTTADLRPFGPLTLGAENISEENNLDLKNLIHISQEKYDQSPEIFVRKNDILVVQRGSTIGKVAMVDKDLGEATINSTMIILKNIKINPRFLCYWLCGEFSQKIIRISTAQTGQPLISQSQVKKFLVCIPSTEEQEQISSIILSIGKRIEQERRFRSHLEILKKGLIQDLLTGRVRVKTETGMDANA
jgi:type I restriction enzyme S subunit